MMVKFYSRYLTAIMAIAFSASAASADLVTSFDGAYTAPGSWFLSDMNAAGTASIDPTMSSGPGDLFAGSAKLTTTSDNNDKAVVGVINNFGTVSTILDSLQFSYDYYKQTVAGGNTAAAPALKLSFYNASFVGDNYVTLIYEPYVNPAFNVPTPDQWNSVSINSTSGLFWQNGGFGQTNSAGGDPYKTLAQWSTTFDPAFLNAQLVQVSVGVGTYNPGQIDYFDNVRIAGTVSNPDTTYNFGVAAVPEPSTMVSAATGILMLGGLAWCRRKSAVA